MYHLLTMANKTAGSLTDADLLSVAKLVAGEQPDGLFSLFKVLRDAEPGAKVSDLLSTPSANEVLQLATSKLKNATQEKEGGIFCRCPNCDFAFITE